MPPRAAELSGAAVAIANVRPLIAIALIATGAVAHAHDFFLLPASFKPAGATTIAATVGSAFPNPEIVVTEDRIGSAIAKAANGSPRVAVTGAKDKALELSLDACDGDTVVGVALKPRDVEYGEDRIDLILGEYQVSEAAKVAVAALPRPRTLKVDSRRFAKTIVCRAGCDSVAAVPVHGFELEFVPVTPGRFRLLQAGSPLSRYPITIASADGKRHEHMTDAKGEVSLSGDLKGSIMLFASTMALPGSPGARFILRLTSLTTER
jgi:hypothetical protein